MKDLYKIPDKIDSVVFIYKSQAFTKSDAVNQIARLFYDHPWFVDLFNILPQKFRDNLYDFVAKNRYKWFGKRKVCNIIHNEE